jgi:hypothetical protein
MYYDGEAEYIDERYVSSYMFEGIEDCLEYLSTYDDVEYWNDKDNYTYDNYYSKLKKQEFENQNA